MPSGSFSWTCAITRCSVQLDALEKRSRYEQGARRRGCLLTCPTTSCDNSLQAYGVDLRRPGRCARILRHRALQKKPRHQWPWRLTVKVIDRRETYKACARSWKRRPDVGSDPEYPDLSASRCGGGASAGEVAYFGVLAGSARREGVAKTKIHAELPPQPRRPRQRRRHDAAEPDRRDRARRGSTPRSPSSSAPSPT